MRKLQISVSGNLTNKEYAKSTGNHQENYIDNRLIGLILISQWKFTLIYYWKEQTDKWIGKN